MQTASLDARHRHGAEALSQAAGVSACWSCRGPVPLGGIFCATCAAVQPPSAADHFERLGLARAFDVDPELLDRSYFQAQRQLHPDRFATRTPRERTFSQLQAVGLNEAYETLKDAVSRAEYLISLAGLEVVPEGCSLVGEQELLHEVMERREALAEAETAEVVADLEGEARRDTEGCLGGLSLAFREGDLAAASRLITRLKYLAKYTQECRIRRARLEAAP
ncbi:MAG: Fe-S protein assembly co-chaperone HscB [Rhodospirillales bacterium]|nr:Fe-S protein assembly co-chaperone HscB [Rhodospirillales bacterium]